MNVLAMIPARMGSQRLPKKNLALLDGVPLINRAIRKCREAGCFDEVVIKLCSQGCSTEKILELYPDLTKEDIRGALEYAAASVDQREIPLPA